MVKALSLDNLGTIRNWIKDQDSTIQDSVTAEATARTNADNTLTDSVNAINGKIPSQASTSNQLADKAFVNSSVQTATANFRGNWSTYADVPSNASSYPADYAGSTTPTVNDYLVVQDASDTPVETGEDALSGTWRFKYSGTWSTDGKSGWHPEYQVNETPLTSEQLAALNSGVTSTSVAQISTNQSNISTLTSAIADKVDKVAGKGLSTNDFTNAEQTKLAGIASGAEVNVQANWNETDSTSDAYIQNKPGLATVATSGSYDDLSNTPSPYELPTASNNTLGGVKIGNNLTIDANGVLSASGGGTIDSITVGGTATTIDANGNVDIVSGTNVKTINGSSVLGSGNLTVSAEVSAGSITGVTNSATSVGSTKLALATIGTPNLRDSAVATAKVANGAITGVTNSATAVGSTKLALATVGTPNLRDSAVATAKIADSAVTTAKINDSAVTTDKINASAVTAAKIGAGAVTGVTNSATSVGTAKLALSTVGTPNLRDSAVTSDKIDFTTFMATGTASVEYQANTTSGGFVTIPFGKTFSKAPLVFVQDTLSNGAVSSLTVSNITTSNFRLLARCTNSSSGGTQTINWLAIAI